MLEWILLSTFDISSVVTLSDTDDCDKDDEEERNEDDDNEAKDGNVDNNGGPFFFKDAANFLTARASEEIGIKSSEGESRRYPMPLVLFQIGSMLGGSLRRYFRSFLSFFDSVTGSFVSLLSLIASSIPWTKGGREMARSVVATAANVATVESSSDVTEVAVDSPDTAL